MSVLNPYKRPLNLHLHLTKPKRLHLRKMSSIPSLSTLIKPLEFRNHPEVRIPRMVYGTAWKKERTATLVFQALKAGFRAIDTAAQPRHYNEAQVGEGIRRAITEGVVGREELYVCSQASGNKVARLMLTYITRSKPNLRLHQAKTQTTCPTVFPKVLKIESTPPSPLHSKT